MMDLSQALGISNKESQSVLDQVELHEYINLKLASCGQPICVNDEISGISLTTQDMMRNYLEKSRQLASKRYPVDQRIQEFLDAYLSDLNLDEVPQLPAISFELDRHGIARELSITKGEQTYQSDYVTSYKVDQGVLHNPASDRRTTKGSFHVAAGGLPVAGDKKEVPLQTFAWLLKHAVDSTSELLSIPFCSNEPETAQLFASLLLRPTVCPEIPGIDYKKSMEVRFFAPGSLVSNLDFVESIFGNAGNPALPDNDAALDIKHWSGHTGCVILAPHLVNFTKQELGLPHWNDATERERRDEMCWQSPDEFYNDGQAFKITARNDQGVIVTLIADNYFGYCKKEVKTQITYAANLYGLAEEEHAGGALAFCRRNHGEEYGIGSPTRQSGYDFDNVVMQFGDVMDVLPEGYGVDKNYAKLIYVPQDLRMDLNAQTITWIKGRTKHSIRLQPGFVYMQPNGYKIEMEKHPGVDSWYLVGTDPEGTFCHKPSTVSGGGKSEISKSIEDAILYNPLFVNDLQQDLDSVQEIFDKDYRERFKPGHAYEDHNPSRPPLSDERSLGSVIKLLSVSSSHTEEYKAWLKAIPPYILALVFVVKRFYRSEWGDSWREYFSVDTVDGAPAHELRMNYRKILASYLRVGFDQNGGWRTFKLRQDFMAAEKIQMEDDISASVVVPKDVIKEFCAQTIPNESIKLIENCEFRLFQRPDDAVIPGYDKQTEFNMAKKGNFLANYEPLDKESLSEVVSDVIKFTKFTEPMHSLLTNSVNNAGKYVCSSAHPRIVNGAPSKNPRYLETRADILDPSRKYFAEMGIRLHRKISLDSPICHPVDSVLTGRRNNPREPGIRPLAVYNPIHFQELPELFMDFVSSLTGKSPSTTGAGSEGALTKGPFNALRTTADLNNALVSFMVTGYAGFSSSAGYIGTNMRVDHDVSLLIPEIWTRLSVAEREPEFMIKNEYLEPVEDFDHNGEKVLGSRLGYRITEHFVHDFFGKLFDNPVVVFTDDILKPELQDLDDYVDGINNIIETHQRVAQQYIDDGSIEDACPPLKALLYIMANGEYEGKTVQDPEIRQLFTKESMLASNWYQERLEEKQRKDITLWRRHLDSIEDYAEQTQSLNGSNPINTQELISIAKDKLAVVSSGDYLNFLRGTIGADLLGPTQSS